MQNFDEKDELNIFKEILNTLPNSIYLKDTEGRYLWLNQSSIGQLKYKHLVSDSIIGKTDFEVFTPEDAEAYAKNDKTVLEKREGIFAEEEVLLPNGRKLTQLSFKEPLCYNNRLIGVLGYTIDITEIREKEIALEKERERAEIANQVKSEFLRNMRHDLRTPFSGILGASELLEAQETDPDKKENLSYIVESAQALLNHLNEILEFVEIESGQFPILEKEFDLRAVLDNVTKMMLPSAKQKPLDFVVTLDQDVPTSLVGDAVRTQRILINLITNAIKFTDKGSVKVHVDSVRQHEPYGKIILRFTIEDTGMGIPEDKQNMIFERFNRLTASYSGLYPGKGLGLRIVKQFLDEIDGQLHLDSMPGKGTKFSLLIPYKISFFPETHRKENHKNNTQ